MRHVYVVDRDDWIISSFKLLLYIWQKQLQHKQDIIQQKPGKATGKGEVFF